MKSVFSRFVKDESGATAIEYGILAAIIGVGIVTALKSVKTELNASLTSAKTALADR
ncbi:MAG: Flp family type IVb pilin [Beijerinckiaceae bacterium]